MSNKSINGHRVCAGTGISFVPQKIWNAKKITTTNFLVVYVLRILKNHSKGEYYTHMFIKIHVLILHVSHLSHVTPPASQVEPSSARQFNPTPRGVGLLRANHIFCIQDYNDFFRMVFVNSPKQTATHAHQLFSTFRVKLLKAGRVAIRTSFTFVDVPDSAAVISLGENII